MKMSAKNKGVATMKGLWVIQYAPRERALKKQLNKEALKKWNKLSITRKIIVIDRMQAKGYFWGE